MWPGAMELYAFFSERLKKERKRKQKTVTVSHSAGEDRVVLEFQQNIETQVSD